jgi:hypothetical protein
MSAKNARSSASSGRSARHIRSAGSSRSIIHSERSAWPTRRPARAAGCAPRRRARFALSSATRRASLALSWHRQLSSKRLLIAPSQQSWQKAPRCIAGPLSLFAVHNLSNPPREPWTRRDGLSHGQDDIGRTWERRTRRGRVRFLSHVEIL